jgi:tetratricopeptide (TPR) repeat protein
MQNVKRKILFLLFLLFSLSPLLYAQVNTDYFMNVGKNELSQGNNAEAINKFNTVVRFDKNNFEAYFLRGIAKYQLGDLYGAESDFTKTLELHPLFVYAWHYRGLVRDNLQDYYKALQDLDKAISIEPYDADLLVGRGTVKIHMGSYLWSLDDLDSAIRIDPKKPLAYMNRAIARSSLNDHEGALKDCNRAIQLDPYNDEVYMRRGIIRYDGEDYPGAIEDYQYAIKLKPDNPYTWFNLAMAHYNNKDTLVAIDDYSRVIELDPYNALSFYNRALLKSQLKDLDGALQDYNKVLMLNPDNVYTYYNRAIIYHILEDYRAAIADYTKSIELFPDFAGAYLNRSEAKKSIKDEKGAYSDYQKALAIIDKLKAYGYDSLTVKQFADSAYFNKIMEFEADFSVVKLEETGNGKSIDLELSFMVQLAVDDRMILEQSRKGYAFNELKGLNEGNTYGIEYALSNRPVEPGQEQAYYKVIASDSSLNHDVSTARAYFLKGILNTMVLNYNSALSDYNRSVQLDPNQPLVYLNRGYLLFEMAERESIESKYSGPVTISWEGAEKAPPKEIPISPDYQKAIEDYDKVIALQPGNAFGYFNRANVKVRLKDYTGAIQDYSAAIEKEPTLSEAFFNRALTLIYLNDKQSACRDLSSAGELGLDAAYKVIKQYCKTP